MGMLKAESRGEKGYAEGCASGRRTGRVLTVMCFVLTSCCKHRTLCLVTPSCWHCTTPILYPLSSMRTNLCVQP